MRKNVVVGKVKAQKKYSALSLTVICSIAVFIGLILLFSIVGITMSIVVSKELMAFINEFAPELKGLLIAIAIVSIVLGAVIAFFSSRFTTHPFTHLITQLNKLASGDYSARLKFGKILSSLTVVKEATDCFNKMAEELENTELLRSDFINNFSHEFKTPIVSIVGFAKLLRQGNISEEERDKYLAAIEEESMRLSSMATNVLNLTKIENQSILTDKTEYNVSEQIRSAVLIFEEKWTRKNISLDLEFDEYTIVANEEMMKQVFINIIDNAIKFAPEGGEVGIKITKDDKALNISISNTGSEIDEENMKKIFSKFYQADESHSSEGNGIGLAIVKKVLELHSAEIHVESENNLTVFTVVYPI